MKEKTIYRESSRVEEAENQISDWERKEAKHKTAEKQ